MVLTIFVPEGRSESSDSFIELDNVTYSSDGVRLAASLWLPDSPGPHPAIVIAHGSGRSLRRNLASMARHFVELGVAVLTYDKRGVGQSGGAYVGRQNASEQNLSLLARDVVAGVSYLRERPDIDGDQIGLWGVSQAGWIIPIAATLAREITFVILISGPTVTVGEENVYSRITDDGAKATDLSQSEISHMLTERGPHGFDPLPYLRRMSMPGLWLLGEDDRSIPIPETVTILNMLIDEDGRDFSYHVFQGVGHGLRKQGRLVDGYWKRQDEFLRDHFTIRTGQ